jgi:hypothetical protein
MDRPDAHRHQDQHGYELAPFACRGHSLQSLRGRSGWAANYVDIDSGDEFWVSGEEALTGEDVWLHAIGISGAGTRPARPGW